MRRLCLLCLFASASLADRFTEVATTQFVGSQVEIAALAVTDGYVPAILSQREAARGHWRSVSLGLATMDQTKFDGVSTGMVRHGGGVVLAIRQGTDVRAIEIHYSGRATDSADLGSVALGGFVNPRVLLVGSMRDGPFLVIAHDGGLAVSAIKSRGKGRVDQVPGKGDVVAATQPFAAGRDGRLAIFAVAPGRLVHLAQSGEAFAAVGEYPFALEGFVPHAIAGDGKELWVAGERAGRIVLLRFDARAPGAPPAASELGAGVAEQLRFLSPSELAIAGAKDGRSWVGVLAISARPALSSEAFLKGAGVVALGINPARRGWTLATANRDGEVTVLRLQNDPALPGDWDPFAAPPEPPPAPVPNKPDPKDPPVIEIPGGRPGDVQGHDGHGAPVEAGGKLAPGAILPRAEMDRERGTDTEIVLINLAANKMTVLLRFISDDGRGSFARVALEPGQRRKVSLADALLRRRVSTFDGYIQVEGSDEQCLVVDAVIRRAGQAAEQVLPRWH